MGRSTGKKSKTSTSKKDAKGKASTSKSKTQTPKSEGLSWREQVRKAEQAILERLERLERLSAADKQKRERAKGASAGDAQEGSWEAYEKYVSRLGGVERRVNQEESATTQENEEEEEEDTRTALERELYQVKSVELKALEEAVERGISKLEAEREKDPSKFEDNLELVHNYSSHLELIESICRSLTVDTAGDVLGVYKLILKAKPFLSHS